MSRIIAIDPGTRACGVAVFKDGELERAFYAVSTRDSFAARLQLLPDEALPPCTEGYAVAIIEQPRAYAGRAAHGDTNDILDLSAMVGSLARAALARADDVKLVPPADWKSNVNPEVCVQRAIDRLTTAEMQRVQLPSARGKAHNVWDAVGIGLWAVGRWWR